MYFLKELSSTYSNNSIKKTIFNMALKYIGDNVKIDPTYRLSFGSIFKRDRTFKYLVDFNKIYPESKKEDLVISKTSLFLEEERKVGFTIKCFSPNKIYINNDLVFKSVNKNEVGIIPEESFNILLNKGYNEIKIITKKTNSGFGYNFGTSSMKGDPFHFIINEKGYEGIEGLIYSNILKSENDICEFYPKLEWNSNDDKGQFYRLYGQIKNAYGIAIFKIKINNKKDFYYLKGKTLGKLDIYIDKKLHSSIDENTNFNLKFNYNRELVVLIKSYFSKYGWGFNLEDSDDYIVEKYVDFKGTSKKILYVGPFIDNIDLNNFYNFNNIFSTINGLDYWKVDLPNLDLRIFYESNNKFGVWNYPLGVTLYGLLELADYYNSDFILNYVKDHIEFCTKLYPYSVWDRKKYGAPGINFQISGIDSLDDCGSFAHTMLELNFKNEVENVNIVSKVVANYISNVQSRREDGALYRFNSHTKTMDNTMWADDLYMSVPFLTKYYKYTNDINYINDAANQFLLFKKYLYIKDKKLMSSVYNFNIGKPTEVPWGRANGWVLFSLSELLVYLPKDHKLRNDLIDFFNELAEGFLSYQDECGMWHQVIDEKESYLESSSTAMFIYGFCRGVRYGWLKDKEQYINSALKGFNALSTLAIDKYGNLYGVCKGSGYSYTKDYYMYDLPWLLNDPHGIGIVILSGIEILKLLDFLK